MNDQPSRHFSEIGEDRVMVRVCCLGPVGISSIVHCRLLFPSSCLLLSLLSAKFDILLF